MKSRTLSLLLKQVCDYRTEDFSINEKGSIQAEIKENFLENKFVEVDLQRKTYGIILYMDGICFRSSIEKFNITDLEVHKILSELWDSCSYLLQTVHLVADITDNLMLHRHAAQLGTDVYYSIDRFPDGKGDES